MIHLDTHVVVWLFTGELGRIHREALRRIEAGRLTISPMVELELCYLHEIGRTDRPGRAVIADLGARLGLTRSRATLADIIDLAGSLTWTRDPFDRLIVASAMVEACPLVTPDEHIRANFPGAVWDT